MTEKRGARHGRASWLRLSAWPLRRKVALALAVPLLLAATLGGLRVRSDLTEASNSSTSAKQVAVLRPAVDYLKAAEQATVAAQDTSAESQTALDTALSDLQAAATDLVKARDSSDLTAEQRNQVDAVLDLSQAMRAGDKNTLAPGTWMAQLRQLQSGVTQLITTIVNAQIDPEPRLEQLAQTLGGRFSLAMQQALVATDRSGKTGSQELFSELGVEAAAIDRLGSSLGSSEPAIAALRTENADRARTVRTGGSDLGGAEAYTHYDQLVNKLLDGIDTSLADSASSARQHAFINAAITLGALLAAILLALLVSRLLLNPIRRVREGTLAVANEELPEAVARIRSGEDPGPIVPIDVTTNEEIGQLARAVDDVHRQAVRLASGEAQLRSQVSEMFVTLSRRNTTLINQQLALIERLERDEEDPGRLESLFRLDHLAARMRRTADSLLILADAPSPAASQDRLTVADALQAASAGVQDYQRVHLDTMSTARITDEAAADVVHLLTELVDNALSYSPPTTPVTLSSSDSRFGLTIEIADVGLGIPPQSLLEINDSLRGGGEVTPDTARRMGLFVVSRLAQKHGIKATLRRNEEGGTTASVFLPASALVDRGKHETVAPPAAERQVELGTGEQVSVPTHAAAPSLEVPVEVPVEVQDRVNPYVGLPVRRPGASLDKNVTPYAGLAKENPVPDGPAVVAASIGEPVVEASDPGPAVPDTEPDTEPELEFEFEWEHGEELLPAAEQSSVNEDTPIFRELRSAWLTADPGDESWRSSEIEEGWDRAARVAASTAEAPVNAAGLPVRSPGTKLVPGGVTKPATVIARDPEAIRARLAAHAAGVSRGRATAAESSEESSTEAGSV